LPEESPTADEVWTTGRSVGAGCRRAVSCVIVTTKARSKNSSSVVTRFEAPLIATF
jgi:hypothetical protein